MTSRCQIHELLAQSLGSGGQRIHTPLQNMGFCLTTYYNFYRDTDHQEYSVL
ncbi:hypothetical protein PAXRUDRAFT_629014 [Paxillus rubicundulus Ve08.2h10]|uniref:Uncharacterized protein n=1 Tax=Paxillus rubicundulus Ve08.2h10 TaxID=930991 RepID=A0A0D0E3C7_9AGAM|nr:hypothetical protein PAXRUDRAFT_629014 [Paxillus rubicundulus Ve08.2h10]